MKTVKDEWQSYKREVLAPDAPAIQVIETQKAFYAGAKSLLYLLRLFDELRGSGLYTVKLEQELDSFAKQVDALS